MLALISAMAPFDRKLNTSSFFILLLIAFNHHLFVANCISIVSSQTLSSQQLLHTDYIYEINVPKKRVELQCNYDSNENLTWFQAKSHYIKSINSESSSTSALVLQNVNATHSSYSYICKQASNNNNNNLTSPHHQLIRLHTYDIEATPNTQIQHQLLNINISIINVTKTSITISIAEQPNRQLSPNNNNNNNIQYQLIVRNSSNNAIVIRSNVHIGHWHQLENIEASSQLLQIYETRQSSNPQTPNHRHHSLIYNQTLNTLTNNKPTTTTTENSKNSAKQIFNTTCIINPSKSQIEVHLTPSQEHYQILPHLITHIDAFDCKIQSNCQQKTTENPNCNFAISPKDLQSYHYSVNYHIKNRENNDTIGYVSSACVQLMRHESTDTSDLTADITFTRKIQFMQIKPKPYESAAVSLQAPRITQCEFVDSHRFQIRLEHNQTLRPNALNSVKFMIEYYAVDSNLLLGRETVRRESNAQFVTLSDVTRVVSDEAKSYRVKLTTMMENLRNETVGRQERSDVVRCAPHLVSSADTQLGGSHPLIGALLCSLVLVMLMVVAFFVWFLAKKRLNAPPSYLRSFKKKKSSCFRATPFRNHREHAANSPANCYNLYTPKREARNVSSRAAYVRRLLGIDELFARRTTNRAHRFMSVYSAANLTNTIRSKLSLFSSSGVRNGFKEDMDSICSKDFEHYVTKMHADGDFGFAQLYDEICTITKTYSYSSDIALLECNRSKNRYSNILTYDHSRVKLSCDDKDESLGYINANYIDGYQKANAYIATQGPLTNTFADFWRMICEKNCSIIVMITNVREKGRIKCDQYWPDEGSELYGNVQVTHLQTINLTFYTKRIFTLKVKNNKKSFREFTQRASSRSNAERLVYQYHFTDWPDHGVPYYILPVLTFIKKSSRENPENGGPIVVHCSAGVGRTGTYIVIDSMMKQLEHRNSLCIHSFLKHIRHQRNYLVQTEEQFVFIYDTLLESIKCGETELTEKNYKAFISSLSNVDEHGLKIIDRQFQLITEFKAKDYHSSFAAMPYNLAKNRNQSIVPLNMSRVILSKKPGVDGSEYINATYLHGSQRSDEFIITQHPIWEFKSNFWQMVWDNNSNHVIALYGDDQLDQCGRSYWLEQSEKSESSMKCDSFTVQLKDETFDMDFVYRDFLLQSIDEDYEFNCRIISACYWPDGCTPVKSAFELVNKVRQLRTPATPSNTTSSNSMGPIIVHDLHGTYRAATFCCLYTMQDLINIEASVNVYELAKMYHLKRPGVWHSSSNIQFLYQAAECLFDEFIQQRALKNESDANMSSISSSSIVSPCSSLSQDSATLKSQMQCQSQQTASDTTSIDFNKSTQSESNCNGNNTNNNNEISKVVLAMPDDVVATVGQTKKSSIGKKRAAAMHLVANMITRSSNFTRNIFQHASSAAANVPSSVKEETSTIVAADDFDKLNVKTQQINV